jgi:hypothetical protein
MDQRRAAKNARSPQRCQPGFHKVVSERGRALRQKNAKFLSWRKSAQYFAP